MTNNQMDAVFNLMYAMAKQYAEDHPEEVGEEPKENDDYMWDDKYWFDENGKPLHILFDHIWEILNESGHGCEIIIHYTDKATKTTYYNDFAKYDETRPLIEEISDAIDSKILVTVNGTDIRDLY